jgi:hypothetical protein
MQIRWFIVLYWALSACGEPVAQKGAKGDQGPRWRTTNGAAIQEAGRDY